MRNEPLKFVRKDDGLICYENRVWVSQRKELIRRILSEPHDTQYFIHHGGDKMYENLKQVYCWNEPNVADYVARSLVCQRVKSVDKRPQGKLQPLWVPEWKQSSISMDFVSGLPKSRKRTIWFG